MKEDEERILPLMVNRRIRLKYIIAPHEVDEERISAVITAIRSQKEFPKGEQAVARFTQVNMKNAKKARVLIIDTIGVLAHLYKYGSFAYIGGGFGAGIHNVLEAATFGKPALFGPNYEKFAEAVSLVRNRGAVVIQDKESLKKEVRRLLDDPVHRQHMADIAEIFVESNRGATKRILDGIRSFGFMPAEFQ
jgi:3-deoxy-D-manno-octulosonic-acid transferase